MFALVLIGWLLTAVALATEKDWLFAAAAPFLLVPGVLTLMSAPAWAALARQATAGGLYGERYREQLVRSHLVRITMGAVLVVFSVLWLALGVLL